MFTKIGKFDKLPPGPKDSVPTDTISKTRPVGEDDGSRGREMARERAKERQGKREEGAPGGAGQSDRADVSLRAVRQFIRERLRQLDEGADEGGDAAAEKPVLSAPVTVQSRAAVAYRLAQQAAPVTLGKRDDDLPVSGDAGLDEKTRLQHELSRVETLEAAGYDRIPVAEGQTFLQALEIAYTALEARK